MHTLTLVPGHRVTPHAAQRLAAASIETAVEQSIRAGFTVGSAVRLGHVAGAVIGYNIARQGDFDGSHYPLLVDTALGVVKCSLTELEPA